MSGHKPNIVPLERAIARLEEGITRYRSDTTDTQIRDGLVLRFKSAYGTGHRTLMRYLAFASASPGQFDEMTFPDLIRTANEQGLLLGDWTDWRSFRDMHGRTSHAYDEKIALDVVGKIPRFLDEATHLRDKLRERLA